MPFIKEKKLKKSPCTDREHNPPTHIVLDPGIYTWKCPSCGKEETFTIPQVSFKK